MAEPKQSEKQEGPRTPAKQKPAGESEPKKLYRSRADRMIAGVCGGMAEFFGVDAIIVRVLWAVSVFAGGMGILAYIASWILMPENPSQEAGEAATPAARNTSLIWGLILIAVGGFFLMQRWDWFGYGYPFGWHFGPWRFWAWRSDLALPILLILAGVFYIVYMARRDKGEPTSPTTQPVGGQSMEKKLTRSVDDKMIGGVCGGLGKYFNIDPTLVRVGWAILTLITNIVPGVIAYIVMLIVVPQESNVEAPGAGTGSKSRPSKSQTKKA